VVSWLAFVSKTFETGELAEKLHGDASLGLRDGPTGRRSWLGDGSTASIAKKTRRCFDALLELASFGVFLR
jgi:hypothetical protein